MDALASVSSWYETLPDDHEPFCSPSLQSTPWNKTLSSSPRTRPTKKPLACTNCRRKKVKCFLSDGKQPCQLCRRVGADDCVLPALDERKAAGSRRLVGQLYSRISDLEAELARLRADQHQLKLVVLDDESIGSLDRLSTASEPSDGHDDNMIVRLCGGQRQLNSDRAGRLRFFGPTSSLHLSESVTSSVLIREPGLSRGRYQWQDDLAPDLQDALLGLYWEFQHEVVPVIHKEAFLHDLDHGHTRYCSKLLVHCMMTRAASISDRPQVRALALAEDDANEDPPFLVRKCATLLDAELNNPGITTLQSLQLLSDIYCVICNDTKGWLDAGGACRLAFELGLHSDSRGLGSRSLSQADEEIRQIAFWSCFSLDRQWALYLGRPQMIKVDDVSVEKPQGSDMSNELLMSIAWADLLEIVGIICDALNGVQTTKHRVAALDQKLRSWESSLDPSLVFHVDQSPAIFLLHMQYSAAVILLHRPLATFGISPTPPRSALSRETCVRHACLVAHYIHAYQEQHGSVLTMSWIALHMIATASTTLIAKLSEDSDSCFGRGLHISCLAICVSALGELEKSHLPTIRVRKVIQQAMRMLDLDVKVQRAEGLGRARGALQRFMTSAADLAVGSEKTKLGASSAAAADDFDDFFAHDFSFDEFLPQGFQTDMLQSFDFSLPGKECDTRGRSCA